MIHNLKNPNYLSFLNCPQTSICLFRIVIHLFFHLLSLYDFLEGSYEAGVAGYKHVYFNATSNTLKIWIATAIFMISSYESVKYLLQLSLRGKLRYSMFILFASVYYSHYYAWWGYFNYWNDDFYSQWNHQLFFTITELVSTICVLTMCDKTVDISVKKCYIILSIALAHILISCVDQFILNIVLGEGKLHQVLRDLFLMLPDLLHVIMPLYEMKKVASRNNKTVNNLMPARYALFSVSGIFFLFTLSRYL